MSESRNAILRERYLLEGETEEQFYRRVADAWGTDYEHRYRLEDIFRSGRGLLNTPALANAGKEQAIGSACFVLPVEDSLDGIMTTLKNAALVHKGGGGTGFSFEEIRGRGELVRSTGRGAPGAVNVLRMYNDAILHITQAGMRPGANMGILPIDHPDIVEFLQCKRVDGDITAFNISVAVPDSFMAKAACGTLSHTEQFLWDSLVEGAWRNGEPGVFFIDTVNNDALHPERIAATNPCGEVPLLPYEACVLGSLNLASYVDARGDFDWYWFAYDIAVMVEALDNVIDRQHYPIPEIEEAQKRYRKIGLGVMGYADMLCRMDLRYGSFDALDVTRAIAETLKRESYLASEQLAEERGAYNGYSSGLPFRRNLCCNVIAPTGTISRIARCSFGIEPHFDVDADGYYDSFILGKQFKDKNIYYDHDCFMPASEVAPEQHIQTQAAWQLEVDQAVSKTVNLPNETTMDDVAEIYIEAWASGCKGVTVLRQGSREDVVIGVAREGDCVGAACAI